MLPSSSDRPAGATSRSLRRWGPLAAIVVTVAVVAAVVVIAGDDGDGDEDRSAPPPGTEPAGTGSGDVTGAISWTRAQEEGLDVTFPEGCDTETGRVALPYYFTPECYADAEPSPDAPPQRGVTDDEIVVVVYLSQENDPILNFITSAIANDDTNQQVMDTYRGYVELFESRVQTYGRKVRLEFLTGSANVADEVAARGDAVKAAEMGAFAVWGGPVLSNAWTEELRARGVICLACPAIEEPEPYAFTIVAKGDQMRTHLAEYVGKKLAGRPAVHAGDEAMHDRERVFGHIWIDTGSKEARDGADDLVERLADHGVELAVQISYELTDPNRLPEQATSAIARLKDAGVTSVIFNGDPVAPATFTAEATAQEWYPEWIIGGSPLVDATAFGRVYDQAQWANAFGISSLSARAAPEAASAYALYRWYHGEDPPAIDTATVLYPQVSVFYQGVQAAGPDLSAESFRDGLFSAGILTGAVSQPTVTYGERGFWDEPDYYGIDDFTELWWDPDAVGPDEIRREGPGMYRYVDGGRRYLPGEWTSDETRAFDPDGAVAIYDEPPEGERPKQYPPPR